MSGEANTFSMARALKAIEHVLFLDEDWAWDGLSVVLSVRLTDDQRIALAASLLNSLSPKQLRDLFENIQPVSNCPFPPFLNATAESKIWADSAYESEIEAYLITCFRRLSANRKADFLEFAIVELKERRRVIFTRVEKFNS